MDLDGLKLGMSIPCEDDSKCDERPAWLDLERFKRGQDFFVRHIVLCTIAMHCSLVVGFSVTSLLDALVFTEMSDTPAKSFRRYIETFLHIFRWHVGDVWHDPHDPAYQSVRSVRRMHTKVASDMQKCKESQLAKMPASFRKTRNIQSIKSEVLQNENTGNYKNRSRRTPERVLFSQYDMALVQCGFMGAIVMYPRKLGLIRASRKDLEDYIHFWRGIGHLVGVADEYNICGGDYEQTVSICKQIEEEVLIPGILQPAVHFARMADAYCEGVNTVTLFPLYTKEAITAYVLGGMSRPVGPLRFADRLRVLWYKMFRNIIAWCPVFERLLNWNMMRRFKMVLKKIHEARLARCQK